MAVTEIDNPGVIGKKRRNGKVSNKRDGRLNEAKHHSKGESWSAEKKLECATLYTVYGNARQVGDLSGVPAGTIRQWKTRDWWKEMVEAVRAETEDVFDAKMTKIIDKALEKTMERLENGDQMYDTKRGMMLNKEVSARDAAMTAAILYDKRQLVREKPTQRIEQVTTDERLGKLSEEFAKFARAKTIDGEVELL